jgi:WD40 repeat protein
LQKYLGHFSATVTTIALGLAAPAANADVMYGTAFSNTLGTSQIYTLNTSTGAATLVGTPATAFISGLAFAPNGSLLGSGSQLWSVSPTNGSAVSLGALPELIVDISFSPTGQLWGIGNGSNTLWRIDPSNGQPLAAGALSGIQAGGINSIAFNSQGGLFGLGQGTLYSINSQTFAASVITSVSPCCTVRGLTFTSDGSLFTSQGASLSLTSSLSSINLQTGVLTAVGQATTTFPTLFIGGLASTVSPIPEPSAVVLFGAGLLAIWSIRRRSRADA